MPEKKPYTPFQEWLGDLVIRPMTKLNIWVYKMSNGRMMGTFPGGAPILLLTAKGRKSGKSRTVALLYLEKNGSYYVVGSKGGMSHHPAWVFNIDAHPECSIQIAGRDVAVRAECLSDEAKADIWPELVEMYPDYAEYQARTDRNIRVYKLSPR